MYALPPLKLTTKCERCGLIYPEEENQCSHCSDLTDKEVIDLKKEFIEEQKDNTKLGKLLLFIALIVALVMIIPRE